MLIWHNVSDDRSELRFLTTVLYTVKRDNKLFRCYKGDSLIATTSTLLSAKKACNYHRRNQLKNK